MNYGVDIQPRKDTDFVVGEVGGVPYKVNVPSGEWKAYLPTDERQKFRNFDSMGCVSFSALNCVETIMHFLLDTGQIPLGLKNWLTDKGFIDEQGHFNACDRYIVKLSGTTSRGNFPPKVWDAIRHYGLIPEKDYPSSDEFNRAEYFAEIPQNLIDKGKEFLKFFDVEYEWVAYDKLVPLASIQYHLKHAPLQVCSATCPPWDASLIQSCDEAITHATEVCGAAAIIYDYDSYSPYLKRLALDYKLPYIMKGVISPKTFNISTEMCRYAWNARPDLQYTYPKENALVNPKDPNDNLYTWAQSYLPYEMYDVIEGKMDWNGVEEKLKPEEMPEKTLPLKKTLIEKIILWIMSLFN
jgi:hypothetical protein